ncbi:ABC transporter substrate-binding protein [Microlunatus soli]|uniref:Multiple sugar transport system substrate-binding protein n=1 Tax=Microlunatus soli TaxID=630515 RepID=A0A1H1U6A7_9ACTN|nr:ABC transporter substrate-binding protein [Microlunatus soli]SDS67359.1 multiple sugar transport system substrate-binding protein [Microlunatus soli]
MPFLNPHAASADHHRPSRRAVLGAAAGLLTAGCTVRFTSPQSQSSAAALTLPDSGAVLPKEKVSIRWLSGGPGAKSNYFKRLVPAYHRQHPQLTIEYDELPNDKIAEVLPLQIRNGNADDIFISAIPLPQLVAAGEVAALDDIVPDFTAWRDNFPFGVVVPGINEFNGKMYGLPASTNRVLGNLMIYNTEYFRAIDVDPSRQALTWDDVRNAARKITQRGAGNYYGLMIAAPMLSGLATTIAQLAGARGVGLDYRTGTYNAKNDHLGDALDLLLAMKADGSFFPGWASLTEQEARARMPQGNGGMIFNGAWNYSVWAEQAPGFSYGVARPPAPETQPRGLISYSPGGGNPYVAYAKSPKSHQAVVGDLLHYLGTDAGQTTWALSDGSADPAWSEKALATARASADLRPQDKVSFGIYDDLLRLGPSPQLRNPQTDQVQLALKPVKPSLSDVVQGVLTGQISDAGKALRKLDDQSEKALDEAIATARKKGAEVSRDDWRFPDWDPTVDYGAEHY